MPAISICSNNNNNRTFIICFSHCKLMNYVWIYRYQCPSKVCPRYVYMYVLYVSSVSVCYPIDTVFIYYAHTAEESPFWKCIIYFLALKAGGQYCQEIWGTMTRNPLQKFPSNHLQYPRSFTVQYSVLEIMKLWVFLVKNITLKSASIIIIFMAARQRL